MQKIIKKIIAELAGVSINRVTGDESLRDDLELDDRDIDDVISEIEDQLNLELYGYDDEFVYVSDIITYVRQQQWES